MKPLSLIFALFILAGLCPAVEENFAVSSRFSPKATQWAEGTIAGTDDGGHFKLHGAASDYARNYAAYHRDFFSLTDPDRVAHLNDIYRDRMKYELRANDFTDMNFAVKNFNDFMVYDESLRYGVDMDKWVYKGDRGPTYLSELRVGDHVVVGYDPNGNSVYSMFRINSNLNKPLDSNVTIVPAPAVAPLNPPPPINQQPGNLPNMRGNTHVMNLSSNETNDNTNKSVSPSGHPMNAGSNATNPGRQGNPYLFNEENRK